MTSTYALLYVRERKARQTSKDGQVSAALSAGSSSQWVSALHYFVRACLLLLEEDGERERETSSPPAMTA